MTGKRVEVGFLVPCDGDPKNLASLIRWDELTKNSELIPAKHTLFIMDACYGGLAVTRYVPPGSMRFAKDMLQRYSRQVLTAGKANETVSDAGGPRPGHSVFTGHLLNALDGAANSTDGILTANGVMAYVYDRVAKDYESRQTPHYGHIDGDGDLIFDTSPLEVIPEGDQSDADILVGVPASSEPQQSELQLHTVEDELKDMLSDPNKKIQLHELVSKEVRKLVATIEDGKFPLRASEDPKVVFRDRLYRYEEATRELIGITVVLGRWADSGQIPPLRMIFERLPDAHVERDGLVYLLAMRWYPISLLMYAGGISALAGENYDNLASILLSEVGDRHGRSVTNPLVIAVTDNMLELTRSNFFNTLPGYENRYTPRSDYVYKLLQPMLEDRLFLGTSYERLFDEFEVLYALVVADILKQEDEESRVWGPPGRFGWKQRGADSPLLRVLQSAEREAENWGPLKAGLFGGSYKRFLAIAEEFSKLISGLRWF
jgi:hypothetical protein